MSGDATAADPQLLEKLRIMRYAERRNLTYWQAIAEPNEVVEGYFLMWELDHARDMLKRNNN